jgi:predicted enzyme related to lactoylglutathione lyase
MPLAMRVEKLKYIVWAADMTRATQFYRSVFDAVIRRESEIVTEVEVAGVTIGIHCGGEGKRTWTGMAFQVADLHAGCAAVRVGGGVLVREPEDTPEEPAHLAMCVDPEGNEFMLTKARHA